MKPRLIALLAFSAVLSLVLGLAASEAPPAPLIADTASDTLATIEDARLKEISGMCASWRRPDLFYVMNDSGNPPLVFRLDLQGRVTLALELEGATNRDWEDIAVGPAGADPTPHVFVADIGDNKSRWDFVTIYRFPEPDAAAAGEDTIKPAVFRWKYPSGPRNAEGFIVDPKTGDGYILSKHEEGHSDVFRLPAPWAERTLTTMEAIGPLRQDPRGEYWTIVTAADLSRDGLRLVTRSYGTAWEHTRRTDEPLVAIFSAPPVQIPVFPEPQGESITILTNEDAVLTVSEKLPTFLHRTKILHRPTSTASAPPAAP